MTSSDPQNLIERAADDLLLALAQVGETDGSDGAFLYAAGRTMSTYVSEVVPIVAEYIRKAHNKIRERDVRFGFDTAVDALTLAGGTQAALAARLLIWSAERTGMSPAEVIHEALGTDEGSAD